MKNDDMRKIMNDDIMKKITEICQKNKEKALAKENKFDQKFDIESIMKENNPGLYEELIKDDPDVFED